MIKLRNLFKLPTVISKKYTSTASTSAKWILPVGYNTGIKIYSCIAQDKVPLILPNNRIATWYTCGPTVYDSAHIGHASCYVKLDIIQRILKNYFQINLVTAMNITDIDDKIIKRSHDCKVDWKTLAQNYETEFWDDMAALNVTTPDFRINVSDNIKDIVAFVSDLINKGIAYKTNDGSVYFEVGKYNNYGKLQRLNVEHEEHDVKKSNVDFALWKSKTSASNEPSFDAPFGPGRPGWHIECSAMASSIFGNQIDFHCGGLDLKFPHHENEEAQSCAYHQKPQWVSYWIHTGQLTLQDETEKMSKSLNNTISISDMLEMFSPEAFRVACLLSNYRNRMEFGLNMMDHAESVLNKLLAFFSDAKAYNEGAKPKRHFNSAKLYAKINETKLKIDDALRDDFDTAKSVAHLLDLISYTSKIINNDSSRVDDTLLLPSAIQATSNFLFSYLEMFGLTFSTSLNSDGAESRNFDNLVQQIINIRNELRLVAKQNKSTDLYKACDDIRNSLKNSGIEIKDHDNSSTWNFNK